MNRRACLSPAGTSSSRRSIASRIAASALDGVVADETQERLRRAMARLTATQREVFVLRVSEGMSYREIAAAVDTTEGAARVHYHNAMRAIKEGKMEATVIYPPTQAADGIRLARLLVQQKGMSDLVQPSVPRRVVLDAPVVTKDNVDEYMPLGFES